MRNEFTLMAFMSTFPDEESAVSWFERQFWPTGRCCGHCGSTKTKDVPNCNPMPYHCSDCRSYFSFRTGTILAKSAIPAHAWLMAIFLLVTSPKGIASTSLARQIGVSQKSTWHMLHRIREVWSESEGGKFSGEVEVDETFFGGKRKNMHIRKRKRLAELGSAAKDKIPVIGVIERETRRVRAEPIRDMKNVTLQRFVMDNVEPGSRIYTDEATAYRDMPFEHEHDSVCHSRLEFVVGDTHTNTIESFWSVVKRSCAGTNHRWSQKHIHRYLNEFCARNDYRKLGVLEKMEIIAAKMVGKTLTYERLVEKNGLPSGSRPLASDVSKQLRFVFR